MAKKPKKQVWAKAKLDVNMIMAIIVLASSSFSVYLYSTSASTNAVVATAQAQVGYHETGDNCNKYSNTCGLEWCAIFVSWVYKQAGTPLLKADSYKPGNPYWRIDGVSSVRSWFLDHAQYTYRGGGTPSPGDAIVFNHSHAGIVDHVANGRVYTVEGNSSDGVNLRDYSLSDGDINGWGHFDNWETMPGAAKDIGAAVGGVWIVGTNGEVYKWSGSDWNAGPRVGGSGAAQIDVGEGYPFIVSNAGNIFKGSASGWTQLTQRKAEALGVSHEGGVFVVDAQDPWIEPDFGEGDIDKWNGKTGSAESWSKVGNAGVPDNVVGDSGQIDVGTSYPWYRQAVSAKIYHYVSGKWTYANGHANDIGIGIDHSAWIIGTNGSPYRYNGSSWDKMSGTGTRITVDAGGTPWIVNSAGNIYRYMRN